LSHHVTQVLSETAPKAVKHQKSYLFGLGVKGFVSAIAFGALFVLQVTCHLPDIVSDCLVNHCGTSIDYSKVWQLLF